MKIKGFNQRGYEGTEFVGPASLSLRNSLKTSYALRHIKVFYIALFALLAILAFALIRLQVVEGTYYGNLANKNRIRIKEVKPIRGIIYDRNHTALVKNKPTFSLIGIPIDIYRYESDPIILAEKLQTLGIQDEDQQELLEKLSAYSYLPLALKKDLLYEQGMQIIPKLENWQGLYLQENFKREYIYKDTLSHILGYTSFVETKDLGADSFYSLSDIKGKQGIELSYEKQLRGIKGEKQIQINALGKEENTLNYISAQKGEDIILTIDLTLQEQLQKILTEEAQKLGVTRAAGIIMDPNNGEILAMVSLPSYDNNIFTIAFNKDAYKKLIENPDKPLFNRVISGEYPPGSTFKLILGAGALEDGIVTPSWSVNSGGGIRVGEWFFPDWAPGGHGIVDIRRAIAWSVNTYFYTIGGGYQDKEGLGVSRINYYATKFNLGRETGIDLRGEKKGLVPTALWKENTKGEKWYLGDTYHLSIGQGYILVTPLQMALWTSFFANRGILYRPHLVIQEPVVIDKNFISPQNIDVIREGLRDTVRYGSARSLGTMSNANIAGKTGSAEFSDSKKPHGWFTSFAPYETPEIVLTILMEEGDGSNSAVAAAQNFYKWYFEERSITSYISQIK